jgi:hypothetical protein
MEIGLFEIQAEHLPVYPENCQVLSSGPILSVRVRRFGPPAKARKLGNVQELLRCAIGSRGVEHEAVPLADDISNGLGELGDGNVLSCSDVEELGPGVVNPASCAVGVPRCASPAL